MCEFCNNPFSINPNNNSNSDAHRVEFAGFFSAAAIDAAVRQAKRGNNKNKNDSDDDDDESSLDEDSDGT